MESDDFFVILNTQGGSITPLTCEDESMAMFDTEEDARDAAENNVLGEAFGYEVFERGYGC